MKANKKLVQQQLCQETGNIVLLKDLSNIATANKQRKSRNNLDVTVTTLMDKYDATVEAYCDNEKNFLGLFFQDRQMKQAFDAYPEFICLDATYKLLELGFPVYLMVCEDANGQSEIIAVCLLASEDADSIHWMIDVFKKYNPRSKDVCVVMADKDIKERDVLKSCLPNATVLICLFHTLRSLRREVTCDKMGISSGQRTLCLELLQKMAYAPSESEYDKIYSQFQNDAPREVVDYFNTNWHVIRKEWVLGLKFGPSSFLNSTNNRLESINGKLKQVISRNSSLEEFVEHFFIILTALRTERDHRAALTFQKVKVYPFQVDSPEAEYSKILTPYAFSFVHNQIKLISKVKEIKEQASGTFTVATSEGEKVVSINDCECMFYTSMSLPCRHILALRSKLDEPLFDATLCNHRWTTSYYKETQRLFSSYNSSTQSSLVTTASKQHRRKLSQHEKFRKASILTSELASVASEACNVHFDRRIALLKDLITYWRNGEEVTLMEVEYGDSDFLDGDETEFETSNPSNPTQISHDSSCSYKPDDSLSLRQGKDQSELSSLSSDDADSDETGDNIQSDAPDLLSSDTNHCNQQQGRMLDNPEVSNFTSDDSVISSHSHTCDLIVSHSVSQHTDGNGSGLSPLHSDKSKATQSHSSSHKTAHTHSGTGILSPSQSLNQTCGASSVSHSSAAKITHSYSFSTDHASDQVATNGNGSGLSSLHSEKSKATKSHPSSRKTANTQCVTGILSPSQSLNQTRGGGDDSSVSHSSAAKITRSYSLSTTHASDQVSTNGNGSGLSPSHSEKLKATQSHSSSHKRAHTHGGTDILSPSQVLDERNASSVSLSSALKVTRSPSHATACTSNQDSDRSHSENIGGSVQASFQARTFKRTRSLSCRTAHVGNHISHHPHSHSGSSQCGGGALSTSKVSAKKNICSPSSPHRNAHSSDEISAHSHSDPTSSPSHIPDQTRGDGSALSDSLTCTRASKQSHSPSHEAACIGDNVSAHSHSHSGGHTVSLHSTDQACGSSHLSAENTGGKTSSTTHTKTLKRTRSPSHKTSHKTAHTGNHITTHTHLRDGMHILPPSKLPNQTHSSCCKMAGSSVKVSTHDHLHTGGYGGSPSPKSPCIANQSGSAHSHSAKCDCNVLVRSPPRKTARVDNASVAHVRSEAEDRSANPVTVQSPCNISQNLDPSLSEAAAVGGQTSQVSLGIKVPPRIKKRGRPKGHELTTIGLPAKKAKSGKLCAFTKLHTSDKEKRILSWFIDKPVAEKVVRDHSLIEEEEVECRPEKIPNVIVDENVDVFLVRKYFTSDAWLVVEDVMKRKSKTLVWICQVCQQDLHTQPSIICDSCLTWYHFKCVSLAKQPKSKTWFCRGCHAAAKLS